MLFDSGPTSVRTRPELAELGRCFVDVGPTLVDSGPMRSEIGRIRAEVGRMRADVGRMRGVWSIPGVGRIWSKSGQIWSTPGRIWSTLIGCGPISVGFGQASGAHSSDLDDLPGDEGPDLGRGAGKAEGRPNPSLDRLTPSPHPVALRGCHGRTPSSIYDLCRLRHARDDMSRNFITIQHFRIAWYLAY